MISSHQKKLMAGLIASAAFACSTGFAQSSPASATTPATTAQAAPAAPTDATRSFYATLSPEQQKTFDAETLHFGPRGDHHRAHHGPHEAAKS